MCFGFILSEDLLSITQKTVGIEFRRGIQILKRKNTNRIFWKRYSNKAGLSLITKGS